MSFRIGYLARIVGVAQFFVVHGIAGSAWAGPYSWARNNIGDLGNAHCALQPEPEPRYICSPERGLMNGSFVTLGILLVVGVALTGGALWRTGRTAAMARLLLTVPAWDSWRSGRLPPMSTRTSMFWAPSSSWRRATSVSSWPGSV